MTFVQNFVLLLLCAASLEAGSCRNNKHGNKYTKRAEVPTAVVAPPATSTMNADATTTDQRKLVCHLDFEDQPETGTSIKDKTGSGNNGYREKGLLLVNFKGCGNAAYLYCGDILFHGDTFQGKPYTGITIAAWVKINELPGSHSIFDTIGSSHECGQYHFEVNDGNVRWFHRNETQSTVFSVEATGGLVKQGVWVHIAGTYEGRIGKAKIYVNGDLKNMSVNEYGGFLSKDWNMRVGIGDHKNFRPVLGFVDEFRVYNYAVTKKDILTMVNACKFETGAGATAAAPAVASAAPAAPATTGVAAPSTAGVAAPAVPPAPSAPSSTKYLTHDAVLINDDKEKESTEDTTTPKPSPTNQEMEETILKRSKVFRKHHKQRKD